MTIKTDVQREVSKARCKARNKRYYDKRKRKLRLDPGMVKRRRASREQEKRLKEVQAERVYLSMIKQRLKDYESLTITTV